MLVSEVRPNEKLFSSVACLLLLLKNFIADVIVGWDGLVEVAFQSGVSVSFSVSFSVS